ncbi:methylthioribulose-1-phosphate dehydratase isoform X8 [Macaca fascicularis]|uniref:methylthioribulose-1-phosphate dehydratase isoform X8 n=1 Tax=Macaca fascicularis TaxID=9541 RepID=UPI003D15480F
MSGCDAREGDCCSRRCGAQDKEHPRYLIPELCKQFYHLGWVTGTGGGISLKHGYDDMLVVPIIENTPEEKDLKDRMAHAMNEYPDSCAVLVRRHGVYVWGETWEKAKTMCECYDYLFDIAISMKKVGLDPSQLPVGENGIV